MSEVSQKVEQIIREHNLHLCLECGKCSACCPRMLSGKQYSPRLLAQKIIASPEDESYIESAVWECLTCGLCEERCPSDVRFVNFILELRSLLASVKGLKGYRAHDGAVHSWMRIMTAPELKQNRLDWLDGDLQVAQSGPVAFFVGCAPYFDVFFSGIGADTLSFARGGIKLLNHLGVTPVVLGEERCCGHDLLWTGDRANFETLTRLNYQAFKDAGVSEIVTACPECFLTWERFAPQAVKGFDLKITLLLDLVEREMAKRDDPFTALKARVTYQDPCRLARMGGRISGPRALMGMVPELALTEMASAGLGAQCCGNSSFINCDAFSKRLQVERLAEARRTRAEHLLTACPKCMIHLACALRDPHTLGEPGLELRSLVGLLAERLPGAKNDDGDNA